MLSLAVSPNLCARVNGERDLVWKQSLQREPNEGKVIPNEGRSLIQYDWCLYKKEHLDTDTHPQGEAV